MRCLECSFGGERTCARGDDPKGFSLRTRTPLALTVCPVEPPQCQRKRGGGGGANGGTNVSWATVNTCANTDLEQLRPTAGGRQIDDHSQGNLHTALFRGVNVLTGTRARRLLSLRLDCWSAVVRLRRPPRVVTRHEAKPRMTCHRKKQRDSRQTEGCVKMGQARTV